MGNRSFLEKMNKLISILQFNKLISTHVTVFFLYVYSYGASINKEHIHLLPKSSVSHNSQVVTFT